jgi:hypothetical protein
MRLPFEEAFAGGLADYRRHQPGAQTTNDVIRGNRERTQKKAGKRRPPFFVTSVG